MSHFNRRLVGVQDRLLGGFGLVFLLESPRSDKIRDWIELQRCAASGIEGGVRVHGLLSGSGQEVSFWLSREWLDNLLVDCSALAVGAQVRLSEWRELVRLYDAEKGGNLEVDMRSLEDRVTRQCGSLVPVKVGRWL